MWDGDVDATSSRGRRVCGGVFQGGAGPRADPVGPRRGHGAGIVGGRGEQRNHRRLQGEEGGTVNSVLVALLRTEMDISTIRAVLYVVYAATAVRCTS